VLPGDRGNYLRPLAANLQQVRTNIALMCMGYRIGRRDAERPVAVWTGRRRMVVIIVPMVVMVVMMIFVR
jgi:hypothetical protein